MAIAASGALFVADTGNHAVRSVFEGWVGTVAPDDSDPELAAYNRYLAWLAADPGRRPEDYPQKGA